MQDKTIRADSNQQALKIFNAGSIIALAFIILTAGFMVFQNLKVTEELSQTEVIATAFAEGIQTMCSDPTIGGQYPRMCSIAEDYADREHYLGREPQDIPTSSIDIDSVTCSKGVTIITYKDGSESVLNIECNTQS